MKWLAAFLSIYILFLACQTCTDGQNHSHGKEMAQGSDHHSHGDGPDDTCSPFCVCGCCGVQVADFDLLFRYSFPTLIPEIKSPIVSFEYDFDSNVYGRIWQPPQSSC